MNIQKGSSGQKYDLGNLLGVVTLDVEVISSKLPRISTWQWHCKWLHKTDCWLLTHAVGNIPYVVLCLRACWERRCGSSEKRQACGEKRCEELWRLRYKQLKMILFYTIYVFHHASYPIASAEKKDTRWNNFFVMPFMDSNGSFSLSVFSHYSSCLFGARVKGWW